MAGIIEGGRPEEWLIITDLDGTIIDSEASNFLILKQLLDEFGLADKSVLILKGLGEGKDFDDIMRTVKLTKETKERMARRMESLLTQAPTPSLPGAIEHLKYLRGLGFLCCLATDNMSRFVAHVVGRLGLGDVFDENNILTCDSFAARKPSPEIIKEFTQRTGRTKALIVGNSPKEVALARGANCPVVIISPEEGGKSGPRKKQTIDYEWSAFGDFTGKDIHLVHDWDGVRDAILSIVSANGEDGGAP